MSSIRSLALGLAPALIASASLAACATRAEKPVLSQAVVEARAHRNATAEAACAPLASPVSVTFAFGEAQLNELAVPALAAAGKLLTCHPEATAVIVGQADVHGTDQEQATLARARAQAVAEDLRSRGVGAGRLQTQAQGKPPAGDDNHLVILAEGRRW
jgi:outer membrane protein OmpA-like peptidoglycan-associated protein